jgi:hypothetical protein
MMKKYTRFTGHFDGHADVPVQCRAHPPMEHDQGFTGSHRTSPSGKYTHRIDPAAAMVIDGGNTKNTTKNTTFS